MHVQVDIEDLGGPSAKGGGEADGPRTPATKPEMVTPLIRASLTKQVRVRQAAGLPVVCQPPCVASHAMWRAAIKMEPFSVGGTALLAACTAAAVWT